MSTCKHQIRPTVMEILSLQAAFYCENCDKFVEPMRPWRTIRALINAFCLIAILYAAFSKLQGTLQALGWMIGIILAALLLFFALNYLILTKAPLEEARADVNPDYNSEYDDTDDDIAADPFEQIEAEDQDLKFESFDHESDWMKKS